MVQFIGVNFRGDRVHTTVVDRKAHVIDSGSVPVPGIVETPRPGVFEVPHQEWARAGCLALQDTYFRLPVKQRKLWGIGLAGPQGWIAIDPDLEAISPLRLTPDASPIEDLVVWLDANPRQRAHIFALLSPKDYFRFRISGGLAADATQASETGLLADDTLYWSESALDAAGLFGDWMPPIFESVAATGRLSEAGIELTGIPGGIWLVAGADSGATAELAATDFGVGDLLVLLDGDHLQLRLGLAADEEPAQLPAGWKRLWAALADRRSLVRRFRAPPRSEVSLKSFVRECIRDSVEALGAAGHSPRELIVDARAELAEWVPEVFEPLGLPVSRGYFTGREEPGAAFLAGLSKRIFHDPRDLYFKVERALEEEDREAATVEAPSDGSPPEEAGG